jgi:hypothetical protein
MITDPEELKSHKEKSQAAFQSQRNDRDDARKGSSVFITFDMEKTLPLPKLSVASPVIYVSFGCITWEFM